MLIEKLSNSAGSLKQFQEFGKSIDKLSQSDKRSNHSLEGLNTKSFCASPDPIGYGPPAEELKSSNAGNHRRNQASAG